MKLLRAVSAATLALVLSQGPALALDVWADARAYRAVAASCCGAKCRRCLEAARRGEPCARCHKEPAAVPWKAAERAAAAAVKKGCAHHRRGAARASVDPASSPGGEKSAPESRAPRVAGGPCSRPGSPAAAPVASDGARMVAARVLCPVPDPGRREPGSERFPFDFLPDDVPFVPI